MCCHLCISDMCSNARIIAPAYHQQTSALRRAAAAENWLTSQEQFVPNSELLTSDPLETTLETTPETT